MEIKNITKDENISPLREFVNKITFERCHFISKGMKVLEVGCGNIDTMKKLVKKNGGIWFGLDPNSKIATHKGSVKKIPFNNNFFDIVICSQSIEHWYEYITTFDEGISEIFRVLKDRGIFFIDFPIHLHGHPIFMLGKKNSIAKLFNTSSWTIERSDIYTPSEPYYTWQGRRKKYANEWFCQKYIKKNNKSSYIISYLLKKRNFKYESGNFFLKSKIDKFIFISLFYYKFFRKRSEILLKHKR